MTNEALRRKQLDELVLWNVEQMAFPPSEWEAATLLEVLALPSVSVERPPKERLLSAEMVPHHCHANCAKQAVNDPGSRHLLGWLVYGSDLILHSVVEIHGRWYCLTPQLVQAPTQFQFIPDPYIVWLESDGVRSFFRHGIPLPGALRKDPERHLLARDMFKSLMASGMSVADARELIDRKFERSD